MEKNVLSGSNFKAAHYMALICCYPCFFRPVVNDHSSSFVVMLLVVVTIAFVERIHVKIFCNEGKQMVCSRNIVPLFFLVPTFSDPYTICGRLAINAELHLFIFC